MANLCDNTFYAYTEDSANMKVLKDFFHNLAADYEVNDDRIDSYFTSKWRFPKDEMDKLFESIPNKNDIHMRCLSVEYGCLYHALWVCNKDGWEEV